MSLFVLVIYRLPVLLVWISGNDITKEDYKTLQKDITKETENKLSDVEKKKKYVSIQTKHCFQATALAC